MLQPVLNDLLQQKSALIKELSVAVGVKDRTDYVDCWNILDELAEHERRIATLQTLINEAVLPRLVRN